VAVVAAGCNNDEPELPLPIDDLIPDAWRYIMPEGAEESLQPISIDGDEEKEWLLFFTYDNVGADGPPGPIGGVIYDGQQDAAQYDPQTIIPFPYQPSAFLVPYRLLPDWRANKGQGYLGNNSVSYELTSLSPARNEDETVFHELVVYGKVEGGVVTRLSIFQWQGPQVGYAVAYFPGSYNVVVGERAESAVITAVTTLDRLNERSNLCKRTAYQRIPNTFEFPISAQPTIVFCQGTPTAPAYPEAVVLTWLLTSDQNAKDDLVQEDKRNEVNLNAPQQTARVLSLTYQSTAGSEGLGAGALSTMIVTSRLVDTAGVQREYVWTLEEKKPTAVAETARWLITRVVQAP
jgi:hypothetical protein